jgi:hypothetical protein
MLFCNKIKKYLSLLLLIVLLVPLMVSAQERRCPEGRVCIGNPLGYNSLYELLGAVIDFIFYVSIPLAALLIVVSAYFFLASAGEPEKVRRAKHIIIYTLIGLTVVFLSKAIIAMFAQIFGVDI